ncbi:MAG: universal stress protein [Verrucomicrobiales bacterium]|nr:universal stress protein [Verrucomicrobiales bacterium]
MRRWHNILVGIDFSPASKAALKAALRLAAFDKAPITLVHIVEPELADEMRRVNGFDHPQLLRHMEDSLYRFLGKLQNPGQAMEVHLEVNHPFTGLVSACRYRGADLLVLGTRGVQHRADQVGACIRHAPADVFLVREDAGERFKRALVCVDFSATSARALKVAGHLAQCDRTELDCVFAFRPPVQIAVAMEYPGSIPDLPDSRACLNAWRKDLGEFFAPILEPFGAITWRTELCNDPHIRKSLITYAENNDVDLVVMGTHGKTNLVDFLIGTNAESMLKHAFCSILVVKPPEALAANHGFHLPRHHILRSNQAGRLLP